MGETAPRAGTRPVYDSGKRAAAARLSRDHPRWLIMWGTHSRLYFAYPAFDAPPGTILSAPSSGGLRARMRQAELAAAAHPQHAPRAGHSSTRGTDG